jgi:hypothetical protein
MRAQLLTFVSIDEGYNLLMERNYRKPHERAVDRGSEQSRTQKLPSI